MKKKFSILVAMMTIMITTTHAQVFKGRALDEISTTNPTEIIKIKAIKELDLGDGIVIQKGDILTGKMTDIISPQKYHKNATFTFIPTTYTDKNGTDHKIEKEIKATYRQKMKADFKHSEIGIGMTTDGSDPRNSMFVFSPSYIENTKKIINGQGKEVWDEYKNRNTPWGKGEEIKIKANEVIYFNFPDVNQNT